MVSIIQKPKPHAEHYIHEHMHSASRVAPTAAAPITVTAGEAPAWTLGAFSNDFIAADFVPNTFDLHFCIVINLTQNAWYELIFYYGAGDIECARCTFAKQNNFLASLTVPLMTPLLPANSRIRAKVMSGIADAAVDVKVFYHVYD